MKPHTIWPTNMSKPDLQEMLNQVETIPYKDCDKILGSDWLIKEQRRWPGLSNGTEMTCLLLRDRLRKRPGEVDEEQEMFCFLTEVLGKVTGTCTTNWTELMDLDIQMLLSPLRKILVLSQVPKVQAITKPCPANLPVPTPRWHFDIRFLDKLGMAKNDFSINPLFI